MDITTFRSLRKGDVAKVTAIGSADSFFTTGQLVTFHGPDESGDSHFAAEVAGEQTLQILSPDGVERLLTGDGQDRITAAELREGDVVGMGGDSYTVESVGHGDGNHVVIWDGTNEGQPYFYDGTESWPLISRVAEDQSKVEPTAYAGGIRIVDSTGDRLLVTPSGDGLILNATSVDSENLVDVLISPEALDAILDLVPADALHAAADRRS